MRRRIIIASIAFLLLVGIGIAVVLIVDRSPALQNAILPSTNSTNSNTTTTNTNAVRPVVSPDREALTTIARNFTEKYGSYSNQNAGTNLVEAASYASAPYAAILRAQASASSVAPSTEYTGVVTKALVFSFTQQTASAAQVVVTSQQQVTQGANTKSLERDLVVDCVKIDGSWMVNAAVWK